MSSWELRWVLLIIGGLILVAIYLFSKRRRPDIADDVFDAAKQADDNADASLTPITEDKEDALQDLGDHLQGLQALVKEESALRAQPSESRAGSAGAQRPRPRVAADGEQTIVVIHVVAPRPYVIQGRELLHAVQETGLEYGEFQIFHRHIERFGDKQIVFSLANMVKPGTFDPQRMDEFSTPGVSLFMRLPGPMEGLKAFNTMFACAEKLAGAFNAQLLDETRSVLTKQTVDHLREEIQLFGLRHPSI